MVANEASNVQLSRPEDVITMGISRLQKLVIEFISQKEKDVQYRVLAA